ncbi:hypothetical protein K432DRAFT_385138 [Lepidopterella palustris CBS 459.81]|uniref:Hydrophobic surface binding protein n=1 Tax=Lepidopterella palustris CBS 459.81 TaxID=1314670 RepID=A0A8E2E3Q9_9PEZI|nr:hypothetical protein K432DRAFT_385138 [Lepidopterella palustris CBS 459.81]
MHIIPTIIAALAGFAAVSASPFRRTTGTVEGDIATIQSDVISLDSKIKSFSGSLLDALSFLTAYESLSSAITTTTADINASTAFSSSESAVLADQIGGLTNDIIVTLGDAVAKVFFESYVLLRCG